MLAINKLTILYGKKNLFNQVSARILKADCIGLVGSNGSGKTTLLKIIGGITEVDDGVVVRGKKTTVGYLPQEITSFPADSTLYQEAETAFAELLALNKELEETNQRLSTVDHDSPNFESLLEKQGHLQHQLDESDFFRMRSQIEKILTGLGFKMEDLERPCGDFSGGWLMRLMLAKLLLARPALLLLDEPTNHLDIESVTWLEEFLKSYPGSLLIISHDRAFLDNITNRTWEISLGNLSAYKGNYSAFVKEKALRMEIQRAAYDNQQAQIQQTMRFVDRFRSKSTKAKQVQSRLKQLDKMERIELEDTEQSVAFRFPPSKPCGKMAVEVSGLGKQYDNKKVFENINFQLQRGDKLAVVGVNGAGKSTLARILAGEEGYDSGTVRLGHNVTVSYFGQHQARELAPDYTVLETLSHATEALTVTQLRSLLGAFLFRGDDVDKKVRVLSGGEKSRLALARMIATPANLLIMDEPTNHLDMTSQDVLQEALAQYDGAIIIVSHNRFFLDQFGKRVLEIKNHQANLHEGTVSDYLEWVQGQRLEKPAIGKPADQAVKPVKNQQKSKGKRQDEARLRQEKSRFLTPHKKVVATEEKEIETKEKRKAELEQALADPELYKDQDAFAEKNKAYQEVERHLRRHYQRWEQAQEKIEEIENQLELDENP